MTNSHGTVTHISPSGDWVTLLSGHTLFARFWQSRRADAVAICLHGAESHSGWFDLVAQELNSLGLDVLAYDRNGWGKSQGTRGRIDSMGELYDEFSSLLFMLRGSYSRVHLIGMSWGGLLSLYFCHWLGHLLSSTMIVTPSVVLSESLDFKSLLPNISRLFASKSISIPLPYQPEDFSEIPRIQQRIANDPLRITNVTPGFLVATLVAQIFIRSPLWKLPATPLTMLLANSDKIIGNQGSKDFCLSKKIPFLEVNGGHSLVLDNPRQVADLVKKSDQTIASPLRKVT